MATRTDIWNNSNNFTWDTIGLNIASNLNSMQRIADEQGAYSRKMGLLGDALYDPNSAENQQNYRQIAAQFNSSQPNYFEIAASQGLGGSIAGMQQAAAKRNAGLLTNANFGQMMNDNKKTAATYYGQAEGGLEDAARSQQGLLNLSYEDKWRTAELEEKKREFNEQQGDIWGDLLNVGLGIGSSFLGNWAGAAGAMKGLGKPQKQQSTFRNVDGWDGFAGRMTSGSGASQPNYFSSFKPW